MVNAWVGSTVLPDGLAGSGHIQVDLNGPFSELTVNARVDAEPLILDPIRFDRLVAETTIGGSMLRIASARFQVDDGFGEVEGGMAWGAEAGNDQIDLELRGRRIPLEAAASWVGLDQWVDSGTFSFSGALDGPVASPTGAWLLSIDNPILAGLDLGSASTTIGLESGRFSCTDLSCDHGLEGNLFWNVHDAEVGGTLSWSQMPLASLGEEMQRLAGETADVSLDFRVPFGERPTTVLRAKSQFAQLDIRGEADKVEVAATVFLVTAPYRSRQQTNSSPTSPPSPGSR
jgi:hypothetical protein